jgi:hypothetical protein
MVIVVGSKREPNGIFPDTGEDRDLVHDRCESRRPSTLDHLAVLLTSR